MYFSRKVNVINNSFDFDYFNGSHNATDNGVSLYSDYKLCILLTDGLAAVMKNNVYNTVRGDVLLLRPNQIHFGRFLRQGQHRYLEFFIPTDFFSQFGQNFQSLLFMFEDNSLDCVCLLSPEDSVRQRILFLSERISEKKYFTNDAVLFATMLELLNICASVYTEQKKNPDNTKAMAPYTVSKSINFINNHYSENISLTDIADVIGCSVTYLTRTFLRFTGKTVHQYLTECRVEQAKRMLNEGRSVTDACYDSGFGDCSNFIKVFKKHVGVTPNKYKYE